MKAKRQTRGQKPSWFKGLSPWLPLTAWEGAGGSPSSWLTPAKQVFAALQKFGFISSIATGILGIQPTSVPRQLKIPARAARDDHCGFVHTESVVKTSRPFAKGLKWFYSKGAQVVPSYSQSSWRDDGEKLINQCPRWCSRLCFNNSREQTSTSASHPAPLWPLSAFSIQTEQGSGSAPGPAGFWGTPHPTDGRRAPRCPPSQPCTLPAPLLPPHLCPFPN